MSKSNSFASTVQQSHSDKNGAQRSKAPLNRRRMLGMATATGIAAVTAATGKPRTAEAYGELILEVKPTFIDTVRTEIAEGDAIPTGPFYADGPLYADGTLDENGEVPEGAEPVGWWRCWGWTWNADGSFPSGSAQQSFEFEGLGEIQTQGKDMATKAVVGGSGVFRGITGEYLYEDINTENATFRVRFVP